MCLREEEFFLIEEAIIEPGEFWISPQDVELPFGIGCNGEEAWLEISDGRLHKLARTSVAFWAPVELNPAHVLSSGAIETNGYRVHGYSPELETGLTDVESLGSAHV